MWNLIFKQHNKNTNINIKIGEWLANWVTKKKGS